MWNKLTTHRVVPIDNSRIGFLLVSKKLGFGGNIILHRSMIIEMRLRNVQEYGYPRSKILSSF
ncbi:hypothetical protein D3C80_1965370 [compost metagenome]